MGRRSRGALNICEWRSKWWGTWVDGWGAATAATAAAQRGKDWNDMDEATSTSIEEAATTTMTVGRWKKRLRL